MQMKGEKPRHSRLRAAVTFSRTKVMRRITKGACPWDIYSLSIADEMFDRQTEWPSTT